MLLSSEYIQFEGLGAGLSKKIVTQQVGLKNIINLLSRFAGKICVEVCLP
jgi:hypothetical protein